MACKIRIGSLVRIVGSSKEKEKEYRPIILNRVLYDLVVFSLMVNPGNSINQISRISAIEKAYGRNTV